MKLLLVRPPGQEKPGLLDRDGKSAICPALSAISTAPHWRPPNRPLTRWLDPASLPLVPGNPRLGPASVRSSKIVAIRHS